MAEIQSANHNRHKRGVAKSNKLSTRVDLTPMVDLGFLLITFFIFTTTMAQPKAMKLIMPNDSDNIEKPPLAPGAMTLTLLLSKDHSVYYYNGIFDGNLLRSNFNGSELRSVIQQKMDKVQERFGDRRKTIILIKATDEAAYSDIVDALDEMVINDVAKYMLLDADEKENAAILNYK